MRPRDLDQLRIPVGVTLSPDGRRVCWAISRVDLDADAYRGELWIAPTDGSAPPRRLTHGHRDLAPAFSPDGRFIAYLRVSTGDRAYPQLHVLPVDGGEPRRVCEHPLGAAQHVWAPDSRRIAYVARVPEPGRYGTDPDVPPAKEPPRRITTRKYRLDNVGWTIDRRQHVFVVDALDDSAQPCQLTDGDADHVTPAWHPDGAQIAFSAARHDTRDRDFVTDVFLVPAEGGAARQVTASTMPANAPTFTPDGTEIVFLGPGVPLDVIGRTTGLWAVPADASAAPRRLTDEQRHELHDPLTPPPPTLRCDGDGVLSVRLWRGAVELVRIPLEGGEPRAVIDGPRQVAAFDAAAGLVAAAVADDTTPGEIVVVDGDGRKRVLTSHREELAKAVDVRGMREIETTADDGYPVHGWVVTPPGPGPHPVLLSIHGGPHTQYGWRLFDEAQTYAGAGYAVVLGNPRGSQGYGQDHGRAVVRRLGDRDEADLLALLDAALADPALDATRVGVMGGSYGGFMTTLLAGRHDRFAAAISERALNAFDSFAGSSDIGGTFGDLIAGPDAEAQAAQSPLTYADGITCPVLVIHAEEDWRCPLEQGQRLFDRLLRRGVETEMLVFPGEGHELSRSGLPSHRVARFEAILDWWARHLAPR